ncbi:MAG: hypothetical protein RIC03_00185 [Cyclobacteriaceae bacterium]
MRKADIPKEIEQTLASLHGLKRQKAPIGFYERLNQRLSFVEKKQQSWMKRLQLGVAAMLLMSLLNGYLYLTNTTTSQEAVDISDFNEAYFDTVSLIDYDDE